MAAPNRVRRGGRRAPAGSSLLTRPASPCPTRTVAMGKDSSRGSPSTAAGAVQSAGVKGRGRGGGLPGSPWQRAPARHPCAPPGLGPGCWRPLDGRGPRRSPGDGDGLHSLAGGAREAGDGERCGAGPRKRAPRGLRCRQGTPRDAGPALGTAGERGCRLLLRPLLHSRPP